MSRPRGRRSPRITSKRALRSIIARPRATPKRTGRRSCCFTTSCSAIHRSPVYLLNRAIVVAEIEGPRAGIRALEESGGHKALKNYHLYDATLGELYRRAGELEMARQCLEAAKLKTRSPHDHAIIDRRLARCLSG